MSSIQAIAAFVLAERSLSKVTQGDITPDQWDLHQRALEICAVLIEELSREEWESRGKTS